MVPFVLKLLFTVTNAAGCKCIGKCVPSMELKALLYCYLEENSDCSDVRVTLGGDKYSYAACGNVTCGGNRAPSCGECGSDQTSCNGQCEWTDGKCREISTTKWTRAQLNDGTTYYHTDTQVDLKKPTGFVEGPSEAADTSAGNSRIVSMPDESEGGIGGRCVMPFIFGGTTFHKCAPDGDRYWCSTKTNDNGVHVSGGGNWGWCPVKATQKSASTAAPVIKSTTKRYQPTTPRIVKTTQKPALTAAPTTKPTTKREPSTTKTEKKKGDAGQSSGMSKMDESFLNESNFIRCLHGAPPHKYNLTLKKSALKYAKTLTKTQVFKHSDAKKRPGVGENLGYTVRPSRTTLPETYKDLLVWWKEVEFYDPAHPLTPTKAGEEVGHFRQMIWKDSTELGCASWGLKRNYGVCHYSPRGNVQGMHGSQITKDCVGSISKCKEKAGGSTPSPLTDFAQTLNCPP